MDRLCRARLRCQAHLSSLVLTAIGAAAPLGWPAVARAASDVCYQGGPTLANFQLNGTATLGGTSIVLTQDTGNQGGSAMYETKFSSANDFHVNMYVKVSTASSSTPANGMAFVMHNDPRAPHRPLRRPTASRNGPGARTLRPSQGRL